MMLYVLTKCLPSHASGQGLCAEESERTNVRTEKVQKHRFHPTLGELSDRRESPDLRGTQANRLLDLGDRISCLKDELLEFLQCC